MGEPAPDVGATDPPTVPASSSEDDRVRADREFHDATAHLYDVLLLPIFGVYYPTVIEPILDALADRAPGRRALDIGCGTGGVTVELARRGFSVAGLDHSPAMLRLAEAKVREHGLEDRVELSTGDLRAMPYADGEFDAVTCQGVLHHLPDLDGPIGELARGLRPGGVFYITEPCHGSTPVLAGWNRLRSSPRLGRWRQRIRAGQRIRAAAGRPRSPVAESTPLVPEIPSHHEEGPIDAESLLGLLHSHGLQTEVQYWTHFEGLDALPAGVRRRLVPALSRPWRTRRGNLVFVTGRKGAGG